MCILDCQSSVAKFTPFNSITAAVRRSLRVAQLFTGFLIGQFPFGIIAGSLAMRMMFQGIADATAATVADDNTFTDVCSASMEGLSFLCRWIALIKPIVVVSYLEFWFWELCKSCSIIFFPTLAYLVSLHQISELQC